MIILCVGQFANVIYRYQLKALTHPEDISEVVAAGGEDDLVRLDPPPARARQRHVHEVAVQLQVAQRRHDRGLGCNSIDILNFGRKAGPSSGTTSVLGHWKFRHVSELQT